MRQRHLTLVGDKLKGVVDKLQTHRCFLYTLYFGEAQRHRLRYGSDWCEQQHTPPQCQAVFNRGRLVRL